MTEAADPDELVALTAWREGVPATKRTMQVPRRMASDISKWYLASGWLVEVDPPLQQNPPEQQ